MSIEQVAPYSPTTVYGQFSSPFTPKSVTINAHTPYDKVDENESKVYSREYFETKPQTKIRYELPEMENKNEFPPEFPPEYKYEPTIKDESEGKEYTPAEIALFSASSMSSKDIVNNSLKQGYSPEQAMVVKKAQEAYKNSGMLTKDPAKVLSRHSYKVY